MYEMPEDFSKNCLYSLKPSYFKLDHSHYNCKNSFAYVDENSKFNNLNLTISFSSIYDPCDIFNV